MDYGSYHSHRLMIRDSARTDAFAQAIAATVKPGDVVLDVGAGTGVLSLLAAKAGAARVYAIEREPAAAGMAQYLAGANGFGHIIHLLQQDVRHVRLPEKANVLVSEWMGTIGVDENMLGAVLWARDHLVQQGARFIPLTVTALAAPAATAQRADTGFFLRRPYDLDLSALMEPSVHELLMCRRRVQPSDLAADPQPLWTTNLATDPPETVRNPYTACLRFTPRAKSKPTALAAWFTAELAPGITLTNAPDAPDTHWGQFLLPFEGEVEMDTGDTFEIELTAKPVGPGPLQFAWKYRVNNAAWQRHDTMDAEPANPAQQEVPRSRLSRMLAELAMDPNLLADFLADPDKVMRQKQLSEQQRKALQSCEQMRIQEALYLAEQSK